MPIINNTAPADFKDVTMNASNVKLRAMRRLLNGYSSVKVGESATNLSTLLNEMQRGGLESNEVDLTDHLLSRLNAVTNKADKKKLDDLIKEAKALHWQSLNSYRSMTARLEDAVGLVNKYGKQ